MDICPKCGNLLKDDLRSCFCPQCSCLIGYPSITGTRDGFGISKGFFDKRTGKQIDNWHSWERAGYRNPLTESNLKPEYKKIVKEKQKAIKNGTNRSIHLGDL